MATERGPKLEPARRSSGTQTRAIDPNVDLTPEQQARIDEMFGELASLTLYDLLGVPRAADKKAIKRAYHERTLEFHPDRFFRKRLGSFKGKLETIFSRMTDAHDLLCSPERRAAYDAALRANRMSLIDAMLEEVASEMEGAEEAARHEKRPSEGGVRIAKDSERPDAPSVPPPISGAAFDPSIGATIARLRDLHEKRRTGGALSSAERDAYERLRDEFARVFLAAQHLTMKEDETPREAMRVASAIKLEIYTPTRAEKTISLDLSAGGFAALLGQAVAPGTPCTYALYLPGTPLSGRARAVACAPYGSGGMSFRASFALDGASEADRDRLELFVVGAALAVLARAR